MIAQNPEGESYQPGPEEIQKAEESMTEAEGYLSKVREYASADLTKEEQAERFERDGGRYKVDGLVITAKDEKLGNIQLFLGAEEVGKDYYWPFYPVAFLAEDIVKHPQTGECRVRKGAMAVIQGGVGDRTKQDTLKRMQEEADAIKSGKIKINDLWVEDRMIMPPFRYVPHQ